MIQVKCPHGCETEKEYIVRLLLENFLGLAYEVRFEERVGFELSKDGKTIFLNDEFFRSAENAWLDERSMPHIPLAVWENDVEELEARLVESNVPVLYGTPNVEVGKDRCEIGIDILGSCFFMLSRYEELISSERDEHQRFPASASIASKQGFLHRPVVNEYLEILWVCCRRLWPMLERKIRKFRVMVTADVDEPYAAGVKDWRRQLRQSLGDVLKRKSPRKAIVGLGSFFKARKGDFSLDRHLKMFDWMMDINEGGGNIVEFYFIVDHSDHSRDGSYDIDEPVIRDLLDKIHDRGHRIGLHPSYNTFRCGMQLKKEVAILRRVLDEQGIRQEQLGGRQHFLRWDPAETARNWSDAGLDYDSSLGFADHAGFRCGTCYEYDLYDLRHRRGLHVKERPLVAMEVTFFNRAYMGMGAGPEAQDYMRKLKDVCRRFDGDFVLLWHNSTFPNEAAKSMYRNLCINGND